MRHRPNSFNCIFIHFAVLIISFYHFYFNSEKLNHRKRFILATIAPYSYLLYFRIHHLEASKIRRNWLELINLLFLLMMLIY
jgi:hypothetical protein